MTLKEFKAHFYIRPEEVIHFNNSGQAPIPDVAKEMIYQWTERFYKEGALCAMDGWRKTEEVRAKLAHFLGCDISELSFFPTTASALSQAAFGIDFKKGDEILIWDQEYPSNFYPWRMAAEQTGAKLVEMKSENWQTPAEKILEYVSDKTKAIAVSWVQYQTGAVTDLKFLSEKLKAKNIWLIADVIQGAGVRPFHFQQMGFDIVCGGSHKWLCSSYGSGFMIVKKERLSQLKPVAYGAMSFGDPDTPKSFINNPKSDAMKFEPGSKAMIEILALGASLDLFLKFGIENIFSEACRVADRLRTGLKQLGFTVASPEGPVVTFGPSPTMSIERVIECLRKKNVSFAPHRGPGLRLSLHAFNTDEEVDVVLRALKNS